MSFTHMPAPEPLKSRAYDTTEIRLIYIFNFKESRNRLFNGSRRPSLPIHSSC